MNVAILCTNLFNIDDKNKTGSGIFNNILIHRLAALRPQGIDFTVFASGQSATLPLPVESVGDSPSCADPELMRSDKHIIFELALLSKAFSRHDTYDVYHMSFGDGDIAMPFAPFIHKPIVVTLHNIVDKEFTRRYFSLFKDNKNVFFISTSDYQRRMLPMLQYLDTIHHGIEMDTFAFDPRGGEEIMWAGRFIPEKGADVVLQIAKETNHTVKLFGVIKKDYEEWFARAIEEPVQTPAYNKIASVQKNRDRRELIEHFQSSKLFLLPTLFEEAFGLVFVESMACGTPVVTFARGAAPEVVRDGVTGFLVNPSDDDIRGDWVVKKTGFAGLCEAVEKIYALPEAQYARMRQACRMHAQENFSADRMAQKYIDVYKKLGAGVGN